MTDLQIELLRVYGVFKKLCDENGLSYFAYAGTAIGAVRHSGFIPWDDDIDIVMPLDDYYKLVSIFKAAPASLTKGVSLFNGIDEGVSDMTFLRMHSDTTTFINYGLILETKSFTGVYIDILPMIGLPTGVKDRANFVQKLHDVLHHLWLLKIHEPNNKEIEGLKRRYLDLCDKYSFSTSSHVVVVDRIELAAKGTIYPTSIFIDKKNLTFEDTEIGMPSDVDAYLVPKFGDYMDLPPEDERYSAHQDFAIVDLEKSYKDYQRAVQGGHVVNNYFTHLSSYTQALLYEKQLLLQRIPPLQDRIAVELDRVEREVAEKQLYQNPPVKLAAKLFAKSVAKSAQSRLYSVWRKR